MELQGRVAIVTGGAGGIGSRIAWALAREGACVVLADRERARGEQIAAEMRAAGADALFFPVDVGETSSLRRLVADVRHQRGRLDIVVNNAAVWYRERFLETSEEHWDEVMRVNLKGPFFLSLEAARTMIPQRWGRIIHIASQAGLFYTEGQGLHYHASKAALIHLTRVMAFEVGPYNITVNAIAPGGTRTPSLAEFLDRLLEDEGFARQIPLRRFAEPEDIAEAVVFLASERARCITGQVLPINGGALAYLQPFGSHFEGRSL
ncbi:3-oxoacyl-[acyl-carrier-protein] reductase FabG [bacterium HR10]|nr:3-oxoacyl-[acyl-carrier-protein] reductase FabG [bacterium HR10]